MPTRPPVLCISNEGTVRLQSGATLGANQTDVNLRQGATLDLNGASLGTAASATGALDILAGAGTVTNGAVSTTSTLRIGDGNSGSYFSGLIQNGLGTVTLVKSGSGTIHFSGMNTFTGPVTLLGGNLDVTRLANIGAASGLGAGDSTSAATNAASLVFNGGNLRLRGHQCSRCRGSHPDALGQHRPSVHAGGQWWHLLVR